MSVYDFHCFGDLFGQCEKGTKMILQHAVFPVAVFEFSGVVFRLLASWSTLLLSLSLLLLLLVLVLSLVLLPCPTYNEL